MCVINRQNIILKYGMRCHFRYRRDESSSDYFKRFKEIKNQCFSLTISEKDLADLAFNGLRSCLKEKLKGFEYHTVNFLQVKVVGLEFKLKKAKDTF